MGDLKLTSASGSVTLSPENVAGTTTITLPSSTATLATTADVPSGLDDVSGVARATSGLLFNADTAAANALDDYEEGTWTPTYSPASGSFTTMTMDNPSWGEHRYTKIGNRVFITGVIRTMNVSVGTASGNLYVSGLPFTPASNTAATGSVSEALHWTGQVPSAVTVRGDGTNMNVMYRDTSSGNTAYLQVSDLLTGANSYKNGLWVFCSYTV